MRRLHYVEGLLSFFIVGLGQIIKGDGDKGLKMMLVFYFALPTLIYLSLQLNGVIFAFVLAAALVVGVFLWGYNIWDALRDETVI